MSNRSGLVIIGMAVAIIGYALVWSAMTKLSPASVGVRQEFGTLDALTPGRAGVGKGA